VQLQSINKFFDWKTNGFYVENRKKRLQGIIIAMGKPTEITKEKSNRARFNKMES
jgi:hypothetical protein